MQEKTDAVDVRVGVKVIDPGGVKGAGPADDAVDLVSFFQEQIGQVTSVLPGDAGNKSFFHEGGSL